MVQAHRGSNTRPEYRRSESDPMLYPSKPIDVGDDPAPGLTTEVGSENVPTRTERDSVLELSPPKTEATSFHAEEDQHMPGNHRIGLSCIVADFKRTVGTHWKAEMTNFDLKTVAVSFFLFFACIAPAITFGAIYEKATHNWIGAVEMITATSWCGVVYSLIGGQPMMINGGTGPILAFAEILYKMSENVGVPFLTFNAWVGIWVSFYMIVAAFCNLNRIIVHATRFTDEIFALLIATIFIINALGNPFAPVGVFYYFQSDHKSHDEHEGDEDYSYMASALLSLMVCIGTVQIAFILRKAKFSPFFHYQIVRNLLTDFAVVLSIISMTLIANVTFDNTETETLNVPDTFAPTFACCTKECDTNWPDDCPDLEEPFQRRPWLVDLTDLNGKEWVPFMAAGPAILAFILVFLDDGITWHLINHPTHKLTHGEAYNYDTVLIGVMVLINSLLGLPWLVAATVRSLNHVHAMAEKTADGKIVSVKETRLTHLGIHLLCAASIFALSVLKLIPVPVLYGVFLYMGLVSLGTNQFWGRILMFFMTPSRYPREHYTEHMLPRRMHLFTGIQLGLFVLLYVVKAIKAIAIAFPIIIALCIPIRLYLLPKIFTEQELVMIDGDDNAVQAWMATNKDLVTKGKQGKDEHDESDTMSRDIEEGIKLAREMEKESTALFPGEDSIHTSVSSSSISESFPPVPTPPCRQRHRRGRRKKTVSCPEGALFREESVVLIKAQAGDVVLDTIEEEVVLPPLAAADGAGNGNLGSGHDETATAPDGQPDAAAATAHLTRPRIRRQKTVSCPAHLLFAEAERHVQSNYFFG